MTEAQRVPWKRVGVEAVAIVGSILLAFAIDAWWDNRKAAQDEIESLELIHRDLREAQSQLDDYSKYSRGAARSALNAYAALSGPGPWDREKIRTELIRVDRITVRIPTAAYTEVLSTGNLRVIRDRELRDAIVRFYESAERASLILQKNNDAFLDGLLMGAYYGDGLVLPQTREDVRDDLINEANRIIADGLGPDFAHDEDPLWHYASDSPEWNKLRIAVLYAAQILVIGDITAGEMDSQAGLLADKIEVWLEGG